MTIHRSSGWPGCDAECDPSNDRVEVTRHHARTSSPCGRRRLGGDRAAVAGGRRRASARLSPATAFRTGSASRRSCSGWSPAARGMSRSVLGKVLGHDAASPPRRVDRRPGCSTVWSMSRSPRYDRIIGLDLSEVAVDGRQHKAPSVAKGPARTPLTGANAAGSGRSPPTATGSRSAGRSTAPTATTALLEPTLDAVDGTRLLGEIDTLHLDRGYDNPNDPPPAAPTSGSTTHVIQATAGGTGQAARDVPLGMRWPVEAHQQLAVELRSAPPQHRPLHPPTPRPARPRHHPHHHGQAHQVGRPLEPDVTTYPLTSLASIHRSAWCEVMRVSA